MGFITLLHQNVWALALLAGLLYTGSKVRTYYRLRHFKGPFSSGLFSLWHMRALLSWESHRKYKEVCDKYGEIARVGPNDLVTSSPELLAHMNAVRSSYSRAAWFNLATRFQAGKDHLFSQIDEEKHKRRRQQLAPGYGGKENLLLEDSIDTHITEFINLVRRKYTSTDTDSKPMDFARMSQYLALDVISHIGFGEPLGNLRLDEDVDAFLATAEQGILINAYIMALGLTWLTSNATIFKYLGPSEKDSTGLGKMVANGRRVIEARLRRETEKRSDMLASFVRHGLTKEELITESSLQIIAGSDTTATALQGIMLYLLSHPRVYGKLQAEVDAAVREGKAPGSVVSDAQARELPYLQAVIKEGIRIHPPVTNEVPKQVPDGGDTVVVNGETVFLPGGTLIGHAVLAVNRREDLFGPDADKFRPERWLLEKDPKRLAGMNQAHDLVFGHGKYQCLGKAIALTELRKTMFEMMRNFDWCLANPESPWVEYNCCGLYIHNNMWVLASERKRVE